MNNILILLIFLFAIGIIDIYPTAGWSIVGLLLIYLFRNPLIKRLNNTAKEKYTFAIVNEGEDIPFDCWHQKASAKNKNFLNWRPANPLNWKRAVRANVKIAGLSQGKRQNHLILLANKDDFKLSLEPEPTNQYDSNAIKVMAQASIKNEKQLHHIGYIPKEIAKNMVAKFKLENLATTPSSFFLPPNDELNASLKIAIFDKGNE